MRIRRALRPICLLALALALALALGGGAACRRAGGKAPAPKSVFSRVGPLWEPGTTTLSILLPDGRILLMPRTLPAGASRAAGRAELFDGRCRASFQLAGPKRPRFREALCLLADGTVLVSGGVEAVTGRIMRELEKYHPDSGVFEALPDPMLWARADHAAVLLLDGRVLLVGGNADGVPVATAEIFDPVTGKCAPAGDLGLPRLDGFTATRLQDGQVLICGGRSLFNEGLSSVELFDPAKGAFRSLPALASARTGHTATLLQDGRVLVAGGYHVEGDGPHYARSAELFHPALSRFVSTGTILGHQRTLAAATLLPDGRVLLTGGFDPDAPSATTEWFDPRTRAFTPGPLLRIPRAGHAATALADGRVLVAGSGSLVGELLE